MFSKASLFSYLAIGLGLLAIHLWFQSLPTRQAMPPANAAVRFTPVDIEAAGFAPLRLVGVWQVEVDDPRFGGVSALAIDRGKLLALTDSGALIALPKPGTPARAIVRDLPAGPGAASFKYNRDTEALAKDSAGRGWWVAFERWNQLWLYDPAFGQAIARRDLGIGRWPVNKGVEGMVAAARDRLLLFPELGGDWLELKGARVRERPISGLTGSIADAVLTPDGRLLLVTRAVSGGGLEKGIWEGQLGNGRLTVRRLANLPLEATANLEAIAAEPRAQGGMRLWLMTDNDFRPRAPTLLVALDLP